MPASSISIVIPLLNEAGALAPLVDRIRAVLDANDIGWTLLFVDDGSTDDTFERIRELQLADHRISALSLSRNFGKECAIAAGLAYASGEAVVLMDADLQHPPELIPEMLHYRRQGYDIVFGIRRNRDTDGWARRRASLLYYKLFERLSSIRMPAGATDYLLMDRRAVEAFKRFGESNRFSRGIFSWLGFRTIGVPFFYAPRTVGRSKWGAGRLIQLAMNSIFSFSTIPLRLSSYIGAGLSTIAIFYAVARFVKALFSASDVPGYPSLIISIMFFAGIQMLFLGIIGEYVGRIFDETKSRPLFLVREAIGMDVGEKAEAPRPALAHPGEEIAS